MSAAFFWPMPWMYWSAIRTRLLVGIFTPAIRATDFSPVADPSRTGSFLAISGRCPQTRTRRPSPWMSWGPASSENYPTWIRGLLKDSTWFRQPSLCLSSLFRDLLAAFPVFSPPRALELAAAFRSGCLGPLEADFPAFRGTLAPFPVARARLAADLGTFPRAILAPLAIRLAAAAFLDALASTAPIAARMRSISRVPCLMVIMP